MKAGLFIVLIALQGSVWAQSAIQLDPKTATDPLDFVPKGYVVAQMALFPKSMQFEWN
ncbi:MAG: hypothetical protein ACRC5V_03910 [Aeromonas sp.]